LFFAYWSHADDLAIEKFDSFGRGQDTHFSEFSSEKFVHHSNAEVHAIYQKLSVNDQAPMLEGIRRYGDAEAEILAIVARGCSQVYTLECIAFSIYSL
jgi:hypothetical protein